MRTGVPVTKTALGLLVGIAAWAAPAAAQQPAAGVGRAAINWDSAGALARSIPCDTPVVIRAGTEAAGLEAQRRFLDRHYPGHGPHQEGFLFGGSGPLRRWSFADAAGTRRSVCFDISAFIGRLR